MRYLAAVVTVLLVAFGSLSNGAHAATYSYSIKFVCGFFDFSGDSSSDDDFNKVVPGEYATAINIFNPNRGNLRFEEARAYLTEAPGVSVGDSSGTSSVPRGRFGGTAFEIDCPFLFNVFFRNGNGNGNGNGEDFAESFFFKGILHLVVNRRLDIWAVYTARDDSSSDGVSIDVEQVYGRQYNRGFNVRELED